MELISFKRFFFCLFFGYFFFITERSKCRSGNNLINARMSNTQSPPKYGPRTVNHFVFFVAINKINDLIECGWNFLVYIGSANDTLIDINFLLN